MADINRPLETDVTEQAAKSTEFQGMDAKLAQAKPVVPAGKLEGSGLSDNSQLKRESLELANSDALKADQRIAQAGDIADKNHTSSEHQPMLDAAQAGINEHPDHYIKAQGRAAERAAMSQMQADGKVQDLNTEGAANFPIYDIASDHRVASVKVRGLRDGNTLSESSKNAYIRDLEEAIGEGNNPKKFEQAAQQLHQKARQEGAGYPADLEKSQQDAAEYLQDNAELWIPNDHAGQVRNELSVRLSGSNKVEQEVTASRLGLPGPEEPGYDDAVTAMLDRICGIEVKSADIKQRLDKAFPLSV